MIEILQGVKRELELQWNERREQQIRELELASTKQMQLSNRLQAYLQTRLGEAELQAELFGAEVTENDPNAAGQVLPAASSVCCCTSGPAQPSQTGAGPAAWRRCRWPPTACCCSFRQQLESLTPPKMAASMRLPRRLSAPRRSGFRQRRTGSSEPASSFAGSRKCSLPRSCMSGSCMSDSTAPAGIA